MKITLGFSPCPNDTFMFAALVNGMIETGGLEFDVRLADVETLNEWAGSSTLDITKISFNRALSLEAKYTLLSSGAALGNGCGPLLVARQILDPKDILRGPVAMPGQWTTAHLLFSIFYPDAGHKVFLPFHKIEDAVLDGDVTAGVIIHENRFTYESKGLVKMADLGEEWESKTGLPIPLGGIFSSVSMAPEIARKVDSLIRESILFAWANIDLVMPYVRSHAQEMDEAVMKEHIKLYVNDYSLDLGELGQKAVELLKKMTHQRPRDHFLLSR